MTPKEKSYNLFKSFGVIIAEKIDVDGFVCNTEQAKKCALIAVDEILNVTVGLTDFTDDFEYWQQVKQEIEKL